MIRQIFVLFYVFFVLLTILPNINWLANLILLKELFLIENQAFASLLLI